MTRNQKTTIAIDLAIRKSGIVLLDEHKKLIYYDWVELPKWENNVSYTLTIFSEWKDKISRIKEIILERNCNIELIVELANFNNALHTQRMSLIMGMVLAIIYNNIRMLPTKITNANGWFEFFNKDFFQIKTWTKLSRTERKKMSINAFKTQLQKQELFYKDFRKHLASLKDKHEYVSDIADAFWMAYYYDKI